MARETPCLLGLIVLCSAGLAAAAPIDCGREPEKALPLLKDRALAHGADLKHEEAVAVLFPQGAMGKNLTFESSKDESFWFSVTLKTAEGQKRRPRGYFMVHWWRESGYAHRWMFRTDLDGKLIESVAFRDPVDPEGKYARTKKTEIYRRGPQDEVAREQFAKELRAACVIANEDPESNEQYNRRQERCECTCAFNHKKKRYVVKELPDVTCGTCKELCAPYVKEGIAEMKRSRKESKQP
ncbi:MAG: hypothetical protein HY925_15075 [Elusimicrobia bacterium]|nr:hypothetical protein [Elusimicrobiota bacterium]